MTTTELDGFVVVPVRPANTVLNAVQRYLPYFHSTRVVHRPIVDNCPRGYGRDVAFERTNSVDTEIARKDERTREYIDQITVDDSVPRYPSR